MKHGKKFNHLGRKAAHRKSMLANMACSLIEHKRIKTTLAKAKALRIYIEPLITKSKKDTTHSRRIVFSYLKQKNAISELFGEISTKVFNRSGGYIRILKLGNRLGDNAQMAYVEFVDYNEDYISDKPKRKKSRRTRKKNQNNSLDNTILEEKSVEDKAVKEQSVDDKAVKEQSVDDKAVKEQSVDDKAVKEQSVEDKAIKEQPVEDKAVKEQPVEDKAVKEQPVEDKAIKEQPVEDKDVENKQESMDEKNKKENN